MRLIMKRMAGRKALPAFAAALTLLLAACIFAPGKFTSQLDVRKDRAFAFRYTGEIVMIPLMQSPTKDEFEPQTCYDDESSEERECTAEDLAKQKEEWQTSRDIRRKTDAEASQMFMGGIDPNDPNAGREIANKLRRQTGWKKVEYIGNGKFDVDFAVSGRLDRDFTFPTFEGMPMTNAFIQLSLRQDGTVRIEAPGFGPVNSPGAMPGMMSEMAKKSENDDNTSNPADGVFTIRTDAQILANNTDTGPSSEGGMQALVWQVNPRTPAAPTALLKLQP